MRSLITLLLMSGPVCAQSMDSMSVAHDLGTILGSEKACGLSYNQAAIEGWINEHTDAADMSFASTLSMMTRGAELEAQDMSESSKTAYCRSVANTAKHYGFIE